MCRRPTQKCREARRDIGVFLSCQYRACVCRVSARRLSLVTELGGSYRHQTYSYKVVHVRLAVDLQWREPTHSGIPHFTKSHVCRAKLRTPSTNFFSRGRTKLHRPLVITLPLRRIRRIKLNGDDIANSPDPLHMATNDVKPVDIREVGRDT